MKHVPIALVFFVALAFAEEFPINPDVKGATIARPAKPTEVKETIPAR